MKKKIIISFFFLIIVSVSIIGVLRVFSWSEPEYDMPSNYLTPLNTSEDGQVKYGELAVVILRDADNLNYYLNPSTDSNLNQLHINNIQAVDNICLDSGVCLSQIEEYINNQLLVYGAHTLGDCTSAGGTLIDDPDSSMQFCKFTASTCPSSWTQYKNWCATNETTHRSSHHNTYDASGIVYCGSCTTTGHDFSNVAPSTCNYEAVYSFHGGNACGEDWRGGAGCGGSGRYICVGVASKYEIGCY